MFVTLAKNASITGQTVQIGMSQAQRVELKLTIPLDSGFGV